MPVEPKDFRQFSLSDSCANAMSSDSHVRQRKFTPLSWKHWREFSNIGSEDGRVVTLVPPTSTDPGSNPELVHGLRFLPPGFCSGNSGFPPSTKSTPSLFHLAVVLCSKVMRGSCSGSERLASSTTPSVRPCRVSRLTIQSLSATKGD